MTKKLNELPLINYNLSTHAPAPTRKSKDKEDQLTAEAGAERGAIRVQQERIPEKYMSPITSTQNKIRNYFDKNAFRLNDTYAIPVKAYASFEEGYRNLVQQHDAYVAALCMAIEDGSIIEEAKRRMGAEFDPSFLPSSCDAVRSAIRVHITTVADLSSPVITAALNELADDVKAEVEERVRKDMEQAEANGQSSIVSFVMGEIASFLKDVQSRCDGEDMKGKRLSTLMDKFVRITEKLPSYNVTGNPAIANAIAKVYETFKSLEVDNLRKDADYRKVTVETAKTLLSDIEGEKLF
jgi:hypothetical protein